jgi:ABC-type glycerol-3-phosphate transport system permease component
MLGKKWTLSIYNRWFLLFVLPALILFITVIVIPFIVGVFDSFVVWRGAYYFNPVTRTRAASPFEAFVGFANYKAAFADARFTHALWYTVRYTVIALLTLSPLWILLVNAFKPHAAIVDNPLSLPGAWDFQYIINAAKQLHYGKSILITLIVTVVSVALIVLISSMAAWILVRRKGKLSTVIFRRRCGYTLPAP